MNDNVRDMSQNGEVFRIITSKEPNHPRGVDFTNSQFAII